MNEDFVNYESYVYSLRDRTLLSACRSIDACVNYTGDSEKLSKIIQGIADVYRAERVGDCEYAEEEVLDSVKYATRKLRDILEGK